MSAGAMRPRHVVGATVDWRTPFLDLQRYCLEVSHIRARGYIASASPVRNWQLTYRPVAGMLVDDPRHARRRSAGARHNAPPFPRYEQRHRSSHNCQTRLARLTGTVAVARSAVNLVAVQISFYLAK